MLKCLYKFKAFVKPLNESIPLRGFKYETERIITIYTSDDRTISFLIEEVILELEVRKHES